MLTEFELSPTSRAKCKKCHVKIGKGEPRGMQTLYGSDYTGYGFYCHKCTKVIIELGIKEMRKARIEFNKMVKKAIPLLIVKELSKENGGKKLEILYG